MVIRRYRESDLEQILDMFYNTVHTVNAKDYTKSQLDAWAARNPDNRKWSESLNQNIVYVAEINDNIIGFGDLNNKRYIDRLFTHKDFQGIGVASGILNTLENEAKRLGYLEIYTEASITAKSFFEKQKYQTILCQNKKYNRQIFVNYIMKKIFNLHSFLFWKDINDEIENAKGIGLFIRYEYNFWNH